MGRRLVAVEEALPIQETDYRYQDGKAVGIALPGGRSNLRADTSDDDIELVATLLARYTDDNDMAIEGGTPAVTVYVKTLRASLSA